MTYKILPFELIKPEKTAILIIDIQNDYCSEKGKIAKVRKMDLTPVQNIIPKIFNFLKIARTHKYPIIWTRMIEDYNYMPENARIKKLSYKKPLILCSPGTWGFEYYKIKPKRGELEIVKKLYDAFTNPNLNKFLKKKKIKNLIVIGVYTSVCVESTIRSGFNLGYNIILPKDLVAMSKQRRKLHNASLKNMSIIFAHPTTSGKLIKQIKNV